MSEFEKELEKNMKSGKVAHERESLYSDFMVSKRDIERIFEDWQPPKPLVEVPQFVADWFENNEDDLSFKIWGYLINWKLQDKKSDFFKWMKKESECIEILIRMQDGYKVKKEQLYYLKNKNTGHILYRQPKEAGGDFIEVVATINEEYTWFTQDEIDTMHTGSYEKIEVDQ